MAFSAKVIKDSVGPNGVRITTMELTFPRIVLAEFNTHRVFSRNSASSRAIPVEKMLARVMSDPFIPVYWGKNQKGMQADEELSEEQVRDATKKWLDARDKAVESARLMMELGVHKQITNRLLEPFLWHTVIVTSTEWSNFFALRTHKDAQPEIRAIAILALDAYNSSEPTFLESGQAHLPLVDDREQLHADGYTLMDVIKISVGRCARVSYLTHDGKRDPKADIELCDRLIQAGHMSPMEHVAFAEDHIDWWGNFRGWKQWRKTLPYEADYGSRPKD